MRLIRPDIAGIIGTYRDSWFLVPVAPPAIRIRLSSIWYPVMWRASSILTPEYAKNSMNCDASRLCNFFWALKDRNFLFAWQGIANHDKIIKSLKYGPSRAQLQHVVAAPGWGFCGKAVVGIKNNFGKRRIKTRVVFTEKRNSTYLLG
nr:hypothetical protein [uncultured Desulfobacter sp.]